MSIVIVGAGPNLGAAVARRFGREGMSVGLVARDAAKLKELANVLNEEGITADFAAANVHSPRARTAWHTHPLGQTIFVTEGVGRCQHAGGPVEEIRPGDRVFFEPGENHWHGAAPDRFMAHIAMQQVDDQGSAVTWGEHVSGREYNVKLGESTSAR